MRRIAFITFLFFLSGCGTMVDLAKIVRDDPVKLEYIMTPDPELDKDEAKKVKDVALLVSLSAGRRNFMVSLDGANKGKFAPSHLQMSQ